MNRSPALFDLHVHSVLSDGAYSPMQLAGLARRSGLASFALTDHDVVTSASVIREVRSSFDTEIIPGIELSTQLNDRGFHLLGYFVDTFDTDLNTVCRQIGAKRKERMEVLLQRVADLGVRLKREMQDELLLHARPGRRHLARAIVSARQANSVGTAFQRYISQASIDAPGFSIALSDGVNLIKNAGGVAVLAHPPVSLSHDEWRMLVATGIEGIETDFPSVSRCHRRFLNDRAQEYDLAVTSGSDFHGDESNVYLGKCSLNEAALAANLKSKLENPSRFIDKLTEQLG